MDLSNALQPREMTPHRSVSLTQQHFNYKPDTAGQIPETLEGLFAPPLRETVSTASCNCQWFTSDVPSGQGGDRVWIDRWLSGFVSYRFFFQSQISRAHTHTSLSPPSSPPTQPQTNNLTCYGMWPNTKTGGEQVLMNHKQQQDSGAPGPHITGCDYYYYYHHRHYFFRSIISLVVWLLPKQQLVI